MNYWQRQAIEELLCVVYLAAAVCWLLYQSFEASSRGFTRWKTRPSFMFACNMAMAGYWSLRGVDRAWHMFH